MIYKRLHYCLNIFIIFQCFMPSFFSVHQQVYKTVKEKFKENRKEIKIFSLKFTVFGVVMYFFFYMLQDKKNFNNIKGIDSILTEKDISTLKRILYITKNLKKTKEKKLYEIILLNKLPSDLDSVDNVETLRLKLEKLMDTIDHDIRTEVDGSNVSKLLRDLSINDLENAGKADKIKNNLNNIDGLKLLIKNLFLFFQYQILQIDENILLGKGQLGGVSGRQEVIRSLSSLEREDFQKILMFLANNKIDNLQENEQLKQILINENNIK